MRKIMILGSYILMIVLNALANIIPIGGENTGAISDSYPNLFAPAGFTFAIWGVIYVLLGFFTFFLIRYRERNNAHELNASIRKISDAFIISSLANAIWILAWHYRMIGLSLILMLVILLSLIFMMKEIIKVPFSREALLWMKPPVGVYFGWITVATVANVTTFLVSINWNGFGIAEDLWLIAILVVATLISVLSILWSKCNAYGLVIIWALIGILSKHTSETGFNSEYPNVIVTLIVMIIVIGIANLAVLKNVFGLLRKSKS